VNWAIQPTGICPKCTGNQGTVNPVTDVLAATTGNQGTDNRAGPNQPRGVVREGEPVANVGSGISSPVGTSTITRDSVVGAVWVLGGPNQSPWITDACNTAYQRREVATQSRSRVDQGISRSVGVARPLWPSTCAEVGLIETELVNSRTSEPPAMPAAVPAAVPTAATSSTTPPVRGGASRGPTGAGTEKKKRDRSQMTTKVSVPALL
jgi:hypothetical protein